MNYLEKEFARFISNKGLFEKKHRLLVGVSGGIDSVVLCRLLKKGGYDAEIAHANFQLRGAESERDETFTKALAVELDMPFHVRRFNTNGYAAEHKLSVQEAARALRYAWFQEILDESRQTSRPLDWILTAHHANDNAETILMHLFRGTGMAGMQGIPPARGVIRRPLLFAERKAILDYALENQVAWVEDSSNETDKYKRNKLRHAVIPLIEEQYPSLVHTLNESAVQWQDMNAFFTDAMDRCLKKLVEKNKAGERIPVKKWKQLPGGGAILFYWLSPFGFSGAQAREAASLALGQTGHFIDSAQYRLLRNRDWLVLTPKAEKQASIIVLPDKSGECLFRPGSLHWKTGPYGGQPVPADRQIAWLDAAKITYPLLLRPWKEGDYFYPLGMKKKKKVARFLIDAKLPRNEKENIWVLESEKKIIWIIGHRIDERFKVHPATRELLALQFNSVP